MNKERAFVLALSVLVRALIDPDEKPEPKTQTKTTAPQGRKRGRPRKIRQTGMPDLGIDTPDFTPDVAFDFLSTEPRRPSPPPPSVEDNRPKVPMGYSPSRETDEDGTQDSQPWLGGAHG